MNLTCGEDVFPVTSNNSAVISTFRSSLIVIVELDAEAVHGLLSDAVYQLRPGTSEARRGFASLLVSREA